MRARPSPTSQRRWVSTRQASMQHSAARRASSGAPWNLTWISARLSCSRPMTSRQHVTLAGHRDRKSTRLNSSHTVISYAVFCLKKKKTSVQPYYIMTSFDLVYTKEKKKHVD